jgi:hypothetical protein
MWWDRGTVVDVLNTEAASGGDIGGTVRLRGNAFSTENPQAHFPASPTVTHLSDPSPAATPARVTAKLSRTLFRCLDIPPYSVR